MGMLPTVCGSVRTVARGGYVRVKFDAGGP